MRLLRRFAVVLGTAALALLIPVSPGVKRADSDALADSQPVASSSQEGTSSCWSPRTSESGFAQKINEVRRAAGRGALRLDPELSRAARYHTWQMAHKDVLYHTPADRLKRRVTNWVVLGENVGVGGSVQSLHDAFMNSPAHKDNIMLPGFTYVGIGASQRGNRLWVTVIFEAATNPDTPLRMPAC
ncbi:MAG: hypothetical protein QOH26_677 [Actinomycetota bacterium]|jgi:uncharacterized protein YkwD|nr:hypothetical protein [Actinomycetota bacterium]